ncbi:MAG: sulfotransferase domain-containing protein [Planctomycetota bacterium]|jgi:hypothetical protein
MSKQKRLESVARALPPWAGRLGKRLAVWPRSWSQARACRRGFRACADRYPRRILFIAGLPKSGTTWLEKMVSSYGGFHEYLLPDVARHELATGGSHDYELPDDLFARLEGMLVLTKMHVHGSPHNARVLREAGVPYVVLYRDLRDVAVSNFFYVRNTPWHPEHPHYRRASVEAGLLLFAERTLPAYVEWVRSWHANRDPELSRVVRYEQMLADPVAIMTSVADHFGLDASPETVRSVVDAHSFQRMSGGRDAGEASDRAFVRKGVAGDWVNHFTPAVRAAYGRVIGDFLVEHGYEPDLGWIEATPAPAS